MMGLITRPIRAGLALVLAAGLSLSACGNDPNQGVGLRAATGMVKQEFAKRKARRAAAAAGVKATAPDPQLLIDTALKSVRGPAMIAVIEKREVTAILGRVQVNGEYETWHTASKESLLFSHGVLTGTRGLGHDLMASEAEQVIALIRARKAGTAERAYHRLNGLGESLRLTVNCTVTPGAAEKMAIGEISTRVTMVVEECRSGVLKVQNLYWVDGTGRVLKSRQWVNPQVGFVTLQQLRL